MKRLLFAAAGTAAMALLAIIVVLAVNSSRYCAAVNAFCDGRYAEAEEGFAALGRYLDAKDQLLFTQNTMQYLSAEELLKQRQFPEAKACFLTLGSFSDAAARAQECQNHMVYDVAAACMAQGDYEKALNGFRSLGDFLDASAQAASCENEIRYDQAEALLAQEAYAEAAELYRPLSLLAYRDAAQKLLLCDNTAAYQSAAVLLAAGENYAAYRTYQSILGFSDAEARADACVLPFPKNGAQLYSNPGYAKRRSCDFVLDNRNGETAVFVKLYRDNGDLVASMFVHPGMRGRLAVPPGMYSIHEAYGTAWFGETDLFGDKGYYIVDVFEEGLYWEFQKNYIHTLTENVKNGTAQGQRIDSGKF